MKKTIKSLLIFILIGSILFVLTGCGDKASTKKEDKEKSSKQEQEKIDGEEVEDEEIKVEEAEKTEFSMGEWDNNIYTNDFLGLKFNLPEGWIYSSDEEIAEMMNLGTELLNDEQKASAEIAKLTSAYYMVAQDENTGSNVTIVSEKQLANTTTEDYISALKTQLSSVQSMSYKIGETSKEKVGEIETDTLTVSAETYGVQVAQKYYVYKIDKYIVAIIATSLEGETGINEIIECFE